LFTEIPVESYRLYIDIFDHLEFVQLRRYVFSALLFTTIIALLLRVRRFKKVIKLLVLITLQSSKESLLKVLNIQYT
jgi:hypothetical protein